MNSDRITRRGFVETLGYSAARRPAVVRACNDPLGTGPTRRSGWADRSGQPGKPAPRLIPPAGRHRDRGRRRRRRPPHRGDGRPGRVEERATPPTPARLSRHARPQGRRRRDHRHARPLACPARDPGRAGRQGRLRREAGRRTTSPRARRCSAPPARPTRSWPSAPSSGRSSHFQQAVEIVRSGKLGKVFWVQTWNYENISPIGHGQVSRQRGALVRRLRPLARPGARCGRSTPTGSTCCSAGTSTMPAA